MFTVNLVDVLVLVKVIWYRMLAVFRPEVFMVGLLFAYTFQSIMLVKMKHAKFNS